MADPNQDTVPEKRGDSRGIQLAEKPMQFIQRNFLSTFRFRLALMSMLPMGFLSGMKIIQLDGKTCKVTVPYKWLNKNPFGSTFWAVLGMAAEMASGAMVVMYTHKQKPSVATLIVANQGRYHKKAMGITTFECEMGDAIKAAVEKTIQTGEPVEVICPAVGTNKKGEIVAEFTFTWSLKARSPKKQ